MKKYLSILLIVLVVIVTGCNKNKKVEEVKYDVTYNVSENETIKIEEKPEGIVAINKEVDKSKCGKKDNCKYINKYTIMGIKEGETRITFSKKRKDNGKVISKRVYNITVDSDLNIIETHKDRNNG